MKELDQLVTFVAKTHFADLPAGVVTRAKITLMDTVGAILAGGSLPEVAALAKLAARSSGEAVVTLIGQPLRADPAWACLYHGTAGTSFELDEGHAHSKGHPAIHSLPPALALGEKSGLSGQDVLTAFVLGYEVAARVGTGTNLRPEAHPHGTWGTLGAAVAATLAGDSSTSKRNGKDEIGESIRVASNLTLASSFQAAYDGASVRNTYAGVGAQLGLLAAQLVQCGFTGERAGPATVFGRIMSADFNAASLDEALGERYEISRGYFKLHACCRYNHATLDALLSLRAKHSFKADEVERVEVETYHLAAQLSDPAPTTPLGGRFSIPFAVATTLINGSTGPEAFEQHSLENSTIRRLAGRVEIREAPDFTVMLPDRRPARVTVHLTGGRALSHTVYHSQGDPAQPISHDELVTKYFNLAEPIIGHKKAERALELIQKLELLENVQELMKWLTP
jgi:2-methylcitrate dehydratase PrpD